MTRIRSVAWVLLLLTGCGRADSGAADSVPALAQSQTGSGTAPGLEIAPPPHEFVLLEITPAAAHQIRTHLRDQNLSGARLRYTIVGGGCTGFQNKLDLVTDPPTGDDFEFVVDGIPCVVLKRHIPYARGAKIDFGEKSGQRGFLIHQPNAIHPGDLTEKRPTEPGTEKDVK